MVLSSAAQPLASSAVFGAAAVHFITLTLQQPLCYPRLVMFVSLILHRFENLRIGEANCNSSVTKLGMTV